MATVESSIQSALFARVETLVLSPVYPMAWTNVDFTPPASRKYLRVTHLPNNTDRLFVGSAASHQYQGILQVVVCDKIDSGEAGAREVAGLVGAHFPVDKRLTSGSVSVRITKRPNIASALITDTEIQIPVSISYECLA